MGAFLVPVMYTLMCMVNRPRIRDPVADTLDEIADEHGYGSTDEAITHVLREAGYEV